ncbi:MAG: hypothetical protein RL648_574, partial [Verrucomicrobiota bacterium]
LTTWIDQRATGAAQSASLSTLAGHCLNARKALLDHLRGSLATTYDSVILPALPTEAPPDWSLGSDVALSGIAGTAHLNVTDGLFRGSLSGALHLPGLNSSLSVHGLSFSSSGDIQLTASGQTRLEDASSAGPLLTIMPRRPLALERTRDGEFSVAGGVRLELPDGNRIEGFIDIDDPDYAIGFSFAGALTLKLAKELILIRPTIDAQQAAAYTNETLLAAGRFFGSFNKGLEAFAGNAPELPALDQIQLGQPPEFEVPTTSIPTDLIGAWFIGAANATLHPLMQGSAEVYANSVKSLQDALSNMDADLEAIRQETVTDLALLKRLQANIDLHKDIADGLDDMAVQLIFNGDTGKLFETLVDNTQKQVDVIKERLTGLPADVSPKIGFGTARALLEAAGTNAQAGGQADITDITSTIITKMREWNTKTLSDYGLNPDGTIKDAATFDNLTFEEALGLLIYALEESATQTTLVGTTPLPTGVFEAAANKVLMESTTAMDAAIATKDLKGMAIGNARIVHTIHTFQYLGLVLPEPHDIEFYAQKCATAVNLIIASAGSPETGAKSANSRLAAGAHHVELEIKRASAMSRRLLGIEEKPKSPSNQNAPTPQSLGPVARVEPSTAAPQGTEPSIFEAFWRILTIGDDGPNPQFKAQLLSLMEGVNEDAAALAADADAIEKDLTGSLARLKESTEAIALLKALLPDAPETAPMVEKFTNTWEALHIRWTPIAEAQRLHWLVSDYMEHLHALQTQYANELGTALTTAFRVATEEAVLSLQAISDNLAGLVNTIDIETFTVKLPGDIEVQRLSGELAFNRVSRSWELAFGGKLRFPDIDAFFEVPYGTIQSSGDFSLSLKSVLNAPFGLDPSFRLQVSIPSPGGQPLSGRLPFISGFDSNGQPLLQSPLLNGFSADGTLYQDLDDGTTQQWSAAIGYAHLDPGHRFTIQTGSNDRQALLSDQVLLFSGGFGFALETDLNNAPAQTGVSVQTELGLLLRPEAASIPVDQRTKAHYYLAFEGAAEVVFNTINNTARVVLAKDGILHLPEEFSLNGSDAAASVALLSNIVIDVDPGNSSPLSFSSGNGDPVRIALNNLGFNLPIVQNAQATEVKTPASATTGPASVPGFQAGVSTILKLDGTAFPVLEQITATLSFPHPSYPTDVAKRLAFEIAGENWRIDGLPTAASISLVNDLQIVDLDGLALYLESGSGIGIARTASGTGDRLTFSAIGSMRGLVASELLSDTNNNDFAFGGGVSATFSWDFVDAPNLQIDTLSFSGRMRLGGAGGITLAGVDSNGIPNNTELATIRLEGLQNIFSPTPQHPFSVTLSGSLGIPYFIALGLKNASLRFDGSLTNDEPELIIGALGFQQGSSFLNLLNLPELPANLTEASIAFADTTRPPSTRFDLDNLIITASGNINIELTDEANAPRLFGAVEAFQVRFPANNNGAPQFNVNSFGLTLENLEIGDLGGISGGLMVGNLNRPEDLFFAGLAGATFNGVGVKAIVAARLDGLIGLCLDVNGGPVGIPLDGGALGGVLLTGATGGVSFNNTFSDPCDFKSYLSLDTSTGRPTPPPQPTGDRIAASDSGPNVRDLAVIPWSDLAGQQEVPVRVAETHRTTTATTTDDSDLRAPAVSLLDCPTGDCPPATLNLFCQRHPSIGQAPGESNYNGLYADSVIFKYSSLSREDVDAILRDFSIDADSLSSELLATAFALAAKSWIGDLIPRLPGTYPDAAAANSAITAELDGFSLTLEALVLDALNNLSGGQSIMDGLYEAAYAGVPCQDVTIVLKGTF